MTARRLISLFTFVTAVTACDGSDRPAAQRTDGGGDLDDLADGGEQPPAVVENWERDLRHTALALDLEALGGRAVITVGQRGGEEGASFEIGGLTIDAVRGPDGEPLRYRAEAGQLHIGTPVGTGAVDIAIDYRFDRHQAFDGWDPSSGVTFLWPTFCSNLYPCRSDPAEGQTMSLAFDGVPADKVAIYPRLIAAEVPSYVPALAVGDYSEMALGTTRAGTEVSVWHLPGGETAARFGTAHLVEVFDFFESTYGEYQLADKVGSVQVAWPSGAYGGMEHHPTWHVASVSLHQEEVHAHEAAHGWFGDGVRIACWEDFVLSEGTASYLAARGLEASGVDLWSDYACRLRDLCTAESGNTVALPNSCGVIDILHDPLWSGVPYWKGAFFFRQVAELIGRQRVDRVLARFYRERVGSAAHMEDLVADLGAEVPDKSEQVRALASAWLGQVDCPISLDDLEALCDPSP